MVGVVAGAGGLLLLVALLLLRRQRKEEQVKRGESACTMLQQRLTPRSAQDAAAAGFMVDNVAYGIAPGGHNASGVRESNADHGYSKLFSGPRYEFIEPDYAAINAMMDQIGFADALATHGVLANELYEGRDAHHSVHANETYDGTRPVLANAVYEVPEHGSVSVDVTEMYEVHTFDTYIELDTERRTIMNEMYAASETTTDPVLVRRPSRKLSLMRHHAAPQWFHDAAPLVLQTARLATFLSIKLDRASTDALLKPQPAGSFIVRRSNRNPTHALVLSLKLPDGRVTHLDVQCDLAVPAFSFGPTKVFGTLAAMIEHYSGPGTDHLVEQRLGGVCTALDGSIAEMVGADEHIRAAVERRSNMSRSALLVCLSKQAGISVTFYRPSARLSAQNCRRSCTNAGLKRMPCSRNRRASRWTCAWTRLMGCSSTSCQHLGCWSCTRP